MHHLMVLLAPQRLLEDLLALARGGPNITSQHILRSCTFSCLYMRGLLPYLSGLPPMKCHQSQTRHLVRH